MRRRGDVLWQHEAARDFRHGLLFVAAPFVLLAALAWSPMAAAALALAALAVIARTAARCAWKAPGRTRLHWQYAVFAHAQKIPALFGQLAWRRAQRRSAEIGLVEYKGEAPAARAAAAGGSAGDGGRRAAKRALVRLLVPLAGLWRRVVQDRWRRVWSLARLQEATGTPVHPSNVVLGPVDVLGTGSVRLGRGALIYPGVHLETQGAGRIDIGDGVVLSRGVHIVAFDRVTLGDGAMVGEYSSLRDADHRRCADSVRHSGHDCAAIAVGRNVWIGRGVTVLKGVALGDSCVVAANAVVTRDVADGTVVGGVPAAVLKTASGSHALDADRGRLAAAPFPKAGA
jgi:acetyltransferase-like isoleucine patch superfamily enzyme